MTGLIDGSLSTLAPIFAIVLATHRPHYAFVAGLATAIGAGVSMAFSEGLSDSGDLTRRGNPYLRGSITGAGTFLGGIVHTLPFLIPHYRAALVVAIITVALELLTLAWIRGRFFRTGFLRSFASVTLAGAIIAVIRGRTRSGGIGLKGWRAQCRQVSGVTESKRYFMKLANRWWCDRR
jgi:hypothetical protein